MDSISKAYQILKEYKGDNPEILYLKACTERSKGFSLGDFQVKYVIANEKYHRKTINRYIRINRELGEKIQEKYNIEFTPQVLFIGDIVGEMGNSYHCYIIFRRDKTKVGGTFVLSYVSKRGLLDEIESIDHSLLDIDFSPFDAMTSHLGRTLKEHQKDGAKFLIANKKAILAHSMGCGKTTSAIVASLAGGYDKILVIPTASLKINWKKEISLYHDSNDIEIVNGTDFKGDKKFTIINYDILKNFYDIPYETIYENTPNGVVKKVKKSHDKSYIEQCMRNSKLFQIPFDCVIIDEAHKLSNKTSWRYKVVDDFLHRSGIQNVFLLTGTPFTNKLMNFYNLLKLIDAPITQDYYYYMTRYCNAKKKTRKDGRSYMVFGEPQNLEELYHKCKNVYQKLSLGDIGVTVDKYVETRYYDLNAAQQKTYDTIWSDYVRENNLYDYSDSELCRQLVESLMIRKFLAIEMVDNTIKTIEDIVEDEEKVVVMCNFREEMDMIMSHFKDKAVLFDGTMSPKKKDEAVERFQKDDKVKVFVGQIVAASVGITLTASHNLIFNSISYSSTDLKQAEDRIFRITSDKDAHIIYQSFTDRISQWVMNIVQGKSEMADLLIKKN